MAPTDPRHAIPYLEDDVFREIMHHRRVSMLKDALRVATREQRWLKEVWDDLKEEYNDWECMKEVEVDNPDDSDDGQEEKILEIEEEQARLEVEMEVIAVEYGRVRRIRQSRLFYISLPSKFWRGW